MIRVINNQNNKYPFRNQNRSNCDIHCNYSRLHVLSFRVVLVCFNTSAYVASVNVNALDFN